MTVVIELLLASGSETWPDALSAQLSPAVAVPQGLVLVPLGDDDMRRMGTGVLGLDRLTPDVAALAAEASHHGAVVYVHQEYFAGVGFEEAVVWRDGRVAFGPSITANREDEHPSDACIVVSQTADNAINQALRHVGIARGDAFDEYAAIGLDGYRSTTDWLPSP